MTTRKRTRTETPDLIPGLRAVVGKIETETVETKYPAMKAQSSRQMADEFNSFYSGGSGTAGTFNILEPMYSPTQLNRHAIASGVLRTCIEAMATNVDSFGYTLEYIGPEGGQDNADAQEEKARVEGVLDHPNGEYSLIDLRRRFRTDRESTGYGTIEVVRNPDDGFPDILYHVPSYTVRMTSQDKETTDAMRYMPRPGANNNMMLVRTRFRRMVQIVGGKRVYFRETGDTRPIDASNGKVMAGASADRDKLASDMVMDMIYAPGSNYGAPRWIGELRSVLGIQESENTNLGFFKDNAIPAMMMMILGGAMNQQGQQDFRTLVQQSRGAGMQNKVVMLEIKGDENAASDKGQIQRPEVKLEPLMQTRQNDAYFQEYEENSAKKVRSSFRLPAIFTGLTEEVRYAVAQASLTLAESQVFGPERNQTDDLFNFQILTYNGEPMRFWRYKSNPPRIHDEAAILKAVETLEKVGAMTPNIAIEIANAMFDMDIANVEDGWGDMPFQFTQGMRINPETGELTAMAPAAGAPIQGQQPAALPPPTPEELEAAKAAHPVRKRRRMVQLDVPHRDAKRATAKRLKPATLPTERRKHLGNARRASTGKGQLDPHGTPLATAGAAEVPTDE